MSKISELSDGGSLVSTDYLIAVRSGGNVKVRMDEINVDQVDLGDNEFIRLGNSQDLTIVHNASNSIINQAGIGDLLIQKAGSTKLTVNSTGIDITGSATMDGLTVDGNNDIQINRDGVSSAKIFWNRGVTQDAAIELDASESLTFSVDDAGLTGKSLVLKNNSKVGFTLADGGDISFYEDTGTTAKLTWDASAEGLAIGDGGSGIEGLLDLEKTDNTAYTSTSRGNGFLQITNTSTTSGAFSGIELIATGTGSAGAAEIICIDSGSGSGDLAFSTRNGGTWGEKVRIDASGNLLVGKTSTALGDVGHNFHPSGFSFHTRDGGEVAYFNRKTSDGSIVNFYKDGTTVGSIGVESSDLVIDGSASNHAGLRFMDSAVNPRKNGALSNGAVDLGGDIYRFKDLYLSGKVHLQYPGNSYYGRVEIDSSTNLIFGAGPNGSEGFRLNSSGNLLVGKTSDAINLAGVVNYGAGIVRASRNGNSGQFGRISTDGDIVTFYKDTVTVGSIGVKASNNMVLDGAVADHAGLEFGTHTVMPREAGADADATINLGGTSRRFKDLYLSGRVIPNGVTTTATAWQSTSNSTSSSKHMLFANPNGNVGDIRTNGSATAYITSSDYRLKENVVDMSGATERLKQLKPSRFNFIADPDTTVDGFLAHEVQEIVPEAIAGEKDAVDADGNPEYQGIDQSKLVPLLVATIQELEARIAALES